MLLPSATITRRLTRLSACLLLFAALSFAGDAAPEQPRHANDETVQQRGTSRQHGTCRRENSNCLVENQAARGADCCSLCFVAFNRSACCVEIVTAQATGCSSHLLARVHIEVRVEIETRGAAKLVVLSFALPVVMLVPSANKTRRLTRLSACLLFGCSSLFRR